jgi:putative DNA primase/helicase
MQSYALKEKTDGGASLTVLEFRCATRQGLTVQDVLPPSIHPETGLPYSWGGNGDWRELPEIPAGVMAVWQQELARQSAKRVSLFGGVDDTPRRRATLQGQLQHISADCSYELYRDIVWAILSFGWPDAEELARQWCETATDRFEEDDFHNVVNSHDPARSPTIGTIYHHARQGGWHG